MWMEPSAPVLTVATKFQSLNYWDLAPVESVESSEAMQPDYLTQLPGTYRAHINPN
jgi:hypothetical protein